MFFDGKVSKVTIEREIWNAVTNYCIIKPAESVVALLRWVENGSSISLKLDSVQNSWTFTHKPQMCGSPGVLQPYPGRLVKPAERFEIASTV